MRELTLTKGYAALVDDEDYERIVEEGRWYADTHHGERVYARHQQEYLHRFILNYPNGDIDHINGDGLDCRKENLKICSRSENMLNPNVKKRSDNKSGVKGVYFDVFYCGWKAEIRINGKKYHLGIYADVEDAAAARKIAEERIAKGEPPK